MEKRATSFSRKKTVTHSRGIVRLQAWPGLQKDAALRNPKKPGTGFIDHSSDGKTQVRKTRRIKKARPRQYALHSPQKTAAPSEARVTTCVERRAS
jgi:hypothetical protein